MSRNNENRKGLEVAQAKLEILHNLIDAEKIPNLKEYLQEMFLASINSPHSEDQDVRANFGYLYKLLNIFFNDVEPYSMFYGQKPDTKA